MNKMLFLGPPGTGKTTKLLSIVEELLACGAQPREVAFCSFTKRASEEAITRACTKFNLERHNFPFFKTLHALAYSMLHMQHGKLLNKKHFDDIGQLTGFEITGSHTMLDGLPSQSNPGNQFLFINQLARARRLPIEEQWYQMAGVGKYDVDFAALKYFSDKYDAYRHDEDLLDFTDMLELCIAEGCQCPAKYVIIDEAQDLSRLQWDFVNSVFRGAEVMFIAGDDDQAIHGWAGADIDYFLNLDAPRSVLEKSYRLPGAIHKISDSITKNIGRRYDKIWESNGDEGEVQFITDPYGLDFDKGGTWFLLARNVYLLNHIAKLLDSAGLVYSVKGVSSVKKEHLTAISCWKDLAHGKHVNPRDAKIMLEYTGMWNPKQCKFDPKDRTALTMAVLRARHGFNADPAMKWAEVLDRFPARDVAYYEMLLRMNIDLTSKPTVMVDTIHGVKGGEADNVVLFTDMATNTYHGYLDSPDNEHRVFYVGATRAKKRLFVVDSPILSKHRYVHLI